MTPSPDPFVTSLAELRGRRSAKWTVYPADVIPAWVAEMDVRLAEPIREVLLEAIARDDTGYVSTGGVAEAYAGFAARRWGVAVDPTFGRVMPDVMRGIAEAVLAGSDGTGGKTAILVDTPCYPPFLHTLPGLTDRTVVTAPLLQDDDGWHLDLAAVEAAYRESVGVHLLCNPHNPTGMVVDRATLHALAELADRYGVRLVVDEVHGPLVHATGVQHTPFAAIDAPAARRAFSLASASKAWNVAGLKCALLLAGPDAADDLARIPEEVSYSASLLGALANIAAFEQGDPWLDSVLAGLRDRFDVLEDRLPQVLPGVRWHRPAATYLAWLDLRNVVVGGEPLGDDPADVLLERAKVALSPGADYGDVGRGWARLNVGTSQAVLDEILQRLADAATA
ncbi:MAG: MalY/PatB family protein [Actinomycetes bacterium]